MASWSFPKWLLAICYMRNVSQRIVRLPIERTALLGKWLWLKRRLTDCCRQAASGSL